MLLKISRVFTVHCFVFSCLLSSFAVLATVVNDDLLPPLSSQWLSRTDMSHPHTSKKYQSLLNHSVLIGDVLAIGGYSTVYHGLLLPSMLPVVLKCADPQSENSDFMFSTLRKEQDYLLAISEHPYILSLVDSVYYEETGHACLVLRKIQRGNIMDWMRRNRNKQNKESVQLKVVILRLLHALAHVHKHGVAHLDIKPQNVLIDEDGATPVLCDFGTSAFLDPETRFWMEMKHQQHWTINQQPFTLGYEPPEFKDMSVDAVHNVDLRKSDVWQLGVLLRYMLTHRDAMLNKNLREHGVRLLMKGFSMEAIELVVCMTHQDPQERCSVQKAMQSAWFDDARKYV